MAGWILVFGVTAASGQQITGSTPMHTVGDSFFENIGASWGLQGKGFNIRFGAPNMAAPPFGGFNPGAGADVGFAFRNGGVGGFFNGNFSQGSQQSVVSQAPCITVTNGVPGFMAVGSLSPFVTSYVPVVGDFPFVPAPFFPEPVPVAPPVWSQMTPDAIGQALRRPAAPRPAPAAQKDVRPGMAQAGGPHNPSGSAPSRAADAADSPARRLAPAQDSTAARPAPSVEEAKRLHSLEQDSRQAEARVYFERGLSAEQAGNRPAAKVYYQMAARRATGDFQREILQRIEAVKKPVAE